MRISIIGAGRVAHHLAHVLSKQHSIIQIYSRSIDKAQALALAVDAQAIQQLEALNQSVDLILIAVSDQAIQSVIQQLHMFAPNVLIAHTSGSTHVDVLCQYHQRAGVFYPLQTFSFEREIDWQNTPLFIETKQAEDLKTLETLANEISQRVYCYSSEQRLSLHLAAVFACNFSNYCYDMAKQVVDAQSVDFSLLFPLIETTAKKALQANPKEMQTGPAMRGDKNIIQMHQTLLQQANRNDLAEVYALLSGQILKRHRSD
jgi:predicted short-subunit dehydrogenase-like oxidoreductase (DUF2520 family)